LKNECKKYDWDVIAVQEVRWKGQGVLTGRDYHIYYSGSTDKHEYGSAFLVKSKLKTLVMDFQPHGERMCKIRIRGKTNNVTLLNVYALTEEKSEVSKDTVMNVWKKYMIRSQKMILELYWQM
jgi:exonuclease III